MLPSKHESEIKSCFVFATRFIIKIENFKLPTEMTLDFLKGYLECKDVMNE